MPPEPPNSAVVEFMDKIVAIFINPIIIFLVALAVLYFLWGLLQFMRNQDNETAQEEGKSHMIWGVAGIFVMFAVYGILEIVSNTTEQIGK